MSRTNEHLRESRRLALGLGISGAALVGLIYFEGLAARAEAGADDRDDALAALAVDAADEAENVVINPAVVAIASPPVEPLAVATVADLDAAAMLPVAPMGPALVIVPDIEGQTLRKAAKQLAAVGLKLSVRDEYGEKIPRELWGEFDVRSQKLEAGAEVTPGSTVKAKVRMRVRYASGY